MFIKIMIEYSAFSVVHEMIDTGLIKRAKNAGN